MKVSPDHVAALRSYFDAHPDAGAIDVGAAIRRSTGPDASAADRMTTTAHALAHDMVLAGRHLEAASQALGVSKAELQRTIAAAMLGAGEAPPTAGTKAEFLAMMTAGASQPVGEARDGVHPKPIAVVTGGNRGMGLETCKQLAAAGFTVVLTARDPARGQAAATELQAAGLDVVHHPLDVTNDAHAAVLAENIETAYGRVDVVVNNAGALFEPLELDQAKLMTTDMATLQRTIDVNTLGPLRVSQALGAFMKRQGHGRIINLSSRMASKLEVDDGMPAYRISKGALDHVGAILQHELDGSNVRVYTVDPGWVRTDMGGPEGDKSVEEGVDTTVWLATMNAEQEKPSGTYKDKGHVTW